MSMLDGVALVIPAFYQESHEVSRTARNDALFSRFLTYKRQRSSGLSVRQSIGLEIPS